MRTFALAILFVLLASPAWANTYFLAPGSGGGNDSNNGLSASTPWLTPNHSVNCGDTIKAAASPSYDPANFAAGKWGTVTCAGSNNVAWIICAKFDACKITDHSATFRDNGMLIDQSYWGVQGWEITIPTSGGTCFIAYPYAGTKNIHHIIFANDICNGAGQGGFSAASHGSFGVDYFVVVGSIAYNSATGTTDCTSGINMYEPVASDSLPGTHIYFAGDFSYDNVEPGTCNGGSPTDGEGLFFDSMQSYGEQMVMDNNISVFNGGRGIQAYANTSANIYLRHNTAYGNNTQSGQANQGSCGELTIQTSSNTQVFLNVAEPVSTGGCAGYPIYAYYAANGNATDMVYSNYGYSALGNNAGSYISLGFSFGPSNTFANPSLTNPSDPGAPSCESASSVPNCMATVIANFTPQTAAAKSYGYQGVSASPVSDPLFPQWLCNVSLPSGLVTMGCLAPSQHPTGLKMSGVT